MGYLRLLLLSALCGTIYGYRGIAIYNQAETTAHVKAHRHVGRMPVPSELSLRISPGETCILTYDKQHIPSIQYTLKDETGYLWNTYMHHTISQEDIKLGDKDYSCRKGSLPEKDLVITIPGVHQYFENGEKYDKHTMAGHQCDISIPWDVAYAFLSTLHQHQEMSHIQTWVYDHLLAYITGTCQQKQLDNDLIHQLALSLNHSHYRAKIRDIYHGIHHTMRLLQWTYMHGHMKITAAEQEQEDNIEQAAKRTYEIVARLEAYARKQARAGSSCNIL